MIHFGVKNLGRFKKPGHCATGTRVGHRQESGWEHIHICVDDASRVACGGPRPDERHQSTIQPLRVPADCYKSRGSPSAG